jgi:DNA-binding MarR family transcriptional regulator
MELLLAALGHSVRCSIVEHLLGLDEEPVVPPRAATHAAMRDHLHIRGGTLTKDLRKLEKANLIVTSPGPRADQPLYSLRQPGKLLVLLQHATDLDAAIGDELALLYSIEAGVKADRARRLSEVEESEGRE